MPLSALRRAFVVLSAVFAAWYVLSASVSAAAETELERTGGPYVPTPTAVVDAMLRMGNVGPDDFVVDLGSGDGVIVLTAARERKASGFGVDIDPELVKLSNAEARRLGVADRAKFQVQDVFKADLSKASVITLYLLPAMMVDLRTKIFIESRPGTRVVSHDYSFDEWQADDELDLEVPEKEAITGVPQATILLWIVPAKISGRWHVQVEGQNEYDVELRQNYQRFDGAAAIQGRTVKVGAAKLRGEEISFTLNDAKSWRQFKGTVSGDTMRGTVDLGEGRIARWSARRGS